MFCYCCVDDEKDTQLDLVPDLKTSAKSYAASATPEVKEAVVTFAATLRSSSRPLGLAVDRSNTRCVIVRAITGGAAAAWNETHPEQEIKIFDQIVEVNGQPCTGEDIASKLDEENAQDVQLTLKRPEERTVVLQKPGRLGIDVNYRKTSLKPWLASIGAGLVADWNANKPDAAIGPNARILAVNGHSGSTEVILEKLRSPSDTMILTVMQYDE
mmetsp:Transcript_30405/g.68244  ORF Transcript_30405/g.68244 Transcript_30405/m.68244 type:complete len:214 (+) Transcript_30405:81-722(+)